MFFAKITNQTKGLFIKTTARQDTKEVPGVISVDETELKYHLSGIVRSTVEETLNAMLDAEADALCKVKRYKKSSDRFNTRGGHYKRELLTTIGHSKNAKTAQFDITNPTAPLETDELGSYMKVRKTLDTILSLEVYDGIF